MRDPEPPIDPPDTPETDAMADARDEHESELLRRDEKIRGVFVAWVNHVQPHGHADDCECGLCVFERALYELEKP